MINEIISFLPLKKSINVIDATFGGGGYSKTILEKFNVNQLLAIDRDPISKIFSKEIGDVPSNIRLNDPVYGSISPVIIVSYHRQYFQLDRMRVTVDKNITYRHPHTSYPLHHKDSEGVVEIKVSTDTPEDYIERLIPYPTSRFSKYSRGMLALGYSV